MVGHVVPRENGSHLVKDWRELLRTFDWNCYTSLDRKEVHRFF
jgi:hypothetical protein